MPTGNFLTASYDPALVVLSIIIAILASYLALDLAGQVTEAVGTRRLGWVLGGGFAMGTGIWSMHFIGMLAFSLPVPVQYHIPLVVLSHLAAVAASAVALYFVSKPTLENKWLLSGSLLMGLGITTMHYTGMAAMRLAATIVYTPWIVALSIAIAIGVSFVGLQLVANLKDETTPGGVGKKIAGAIIMGSAIPGMHYTGMAAASFLSEPPSLEVSSWVVDISALGQAAIAFGTFVILGFTFLSATLNRHLNAQAKKLYRINEQLRQEIEQRGRIEESLKVNEARIKSHQAALVELATSGTIPTGSQEEAFGTITETSAKALGVDRVGIWLFNQGHYSLECVELFERPSKLHSAGMKIEVMDYPEYFQHLEREQVIDASDVRHDDRTRELWENYCAPLHISSLLDVPIRREGQIIGVVCHEHIGPQRTWSLEEINFGWSIANFVSLALEARERALAEESLRENEANYRLTIENALGAVVTMNAHGEISGWTQQAEQIFGWTREEAIGQELAEAIVPPQYRDLHRQGLAHYLKTGEGPYMNKLIEITAFHRDRYEFPVELSVSPFFSRGEKTFSAFIRDITQRKRNEELIKSVAKFPDENPNPVLRVSNEGKILYANLASSRLLKTWGTLMGEVVPEAVRGVIQEVLESRQSKELEVDCHHQICSLVVAPIPEESYVNMYGRDVTERKKFELDLYHAKETAELANRAKSEFLATMSHELRTPLTGILGYSQILKKETGIPPKQQNAVDVIEHSAEHLLSLINEILDLSRIEAGSLEIQVDHLNLSKLLHNLSNIMRARSEDKKLSFTYECLSDLPTLVKGDERRLRQVLINLLDNAIKYTKEGGIALKVGYHEERIRFLVEDTGMGIKPEFLEAIFQSFQRVHDPKMGVEGTGLGLTISQKLVGLMGGVLQVKSSLGEGSQFWFDLDLPEVMGALDESVPVDPKVIGITGSSPRILIVDDKLDNRMFLNDLLTPLGFEVIEAQDGEECLKKALIVHPDAILMDLRMPNMDGLEATRRVRQSPELKNVVIIAISASSFEHNRQECLKAGTDNFLSKPFRINKLLDLLREYLPIELVYDRETQEVHPSPVTPTVAPQLDIPLPAHEILEGLLNLAKRGDVKNILIQIEELSREPDYQVFTTKVGRLAKGFQVTKLCEYLEEVCHKS